MVSPAHFVALSVILFVIGGVGVLVRRNALVVFMCVELMLNAANLAFVAFARMHGALDGQVIAFFVMGRGRGSGRRPGHPDLHLPRSPVGLGRRRQPDEILITERTL